MKLDLTFVSIDLRSAIILIPPFVRTLALHPRTLLLTGMLHMHRLTYSVRSLIRILAFPPFHPDRSRLDFSLRPLPGVVARLVILNRSTFFIP
jgi:hypothetical protein